MLPRVLVHIRKAVRRVARRREPDVEPVGLDIETGWQRMIDRVYEQERRRELAQRLAQTEAALEKLNLN